MPTETILGKLAAKLRPQKTQVRRRIQRPRKSLNFRLELNPGARVFRQLRHFKVILEVKADANILQDRYGQMHVRTALKGEFPNVHPCRKKVISDVSSEGIEPPICLLEAQMLRKSEGQKADFLNPELIDHCFQIHPYGVSVFALVGSEFRCGLG